MTRYTKTLTVLLRIAEKRGDLVAMILLEQRLIKALAATEPRLRPAA